MEFVIIWTCVCIVVYNLIPKQPTKQPTIAPDRIGLDTVLQCYPQAIQRSDDAFRLCYMAETQEGIDLLE